MKKSQARKTDALKGKSPRVKPLWYVYAIECDNASVYIGQTHDLDQRWAQHLKGQGARWTRKYKPVKLFYAEECRSYLAVLKRERELKKTKGRKLLKEILLTGKFRTNKLIGKLVGGKFMATPEMLTAGNIAKQLSVSDAKVKKAIQELKIKPAAKKGVCNYYSKDTVSKVKAALK